MTRIASLETAALLLPHNIEMLAALFATFT